MALMFTTSIYSDSEKNKISIDQVPSAARSALIDKGAKIEEVEIKKQEGRELFESTWWVNRDLKYQAQVTSNGVLAKLEQQIYPQ